MAIDRGTGLRQTRDFIEMAADYVDDVKFTFGTSTFYDLEIIKEKVALLTRAGIDVQPGGTMVEVATWQGVFGKFLDRAKEIGFTTIEVSDGTVNMDDKTRAQIIKAVKSYGFKVISEVGSKDPHAPKPMEVLKRQINHDLAAGVYKVIIEAKEGGVHTTIYDNDGNVKEEEIDKLIAGLDDPDCLVWEAPEKDQQQYLIKRFGLNVNLGNVPVADVVALEALRNAVGGYAFKREYLKTSGELTV